MFQNVTSTLKPLFNLKAMTSITLYVSNLHTVVLTDTFTPRKSNQSNKIPHKCHSCIVRVASQEPSARGTAARLLHDSGRRMAQLPPRIPLGLPSGRVRRTLQQQRVRHRTVRDARVGPQPAFHLQGCAAEQDQEVWRWFTQPLGLR